MQEDKRPRRWGDALTLAVELIYSVLLICAVSGSVLEINNVMWWLSAPVMFLYESDFLWVGGASVEWQCWAWRNMNRSGSVWNLLLTLEWVQEGQQKIEPQLKTEAIE